MRETNAPPIENFCVRYWFQVYAPNDTSEYEAFVDEVNDTLWRVANSESICHRRNALQFFACLDETCIANFILYLLIQVVTGYEGTRGYGNLRIREYGF